MPTFLDIEILDWFSDPAIASLEPWRQHRMMRFGLATTYGLLSDRNFNEGERGFITWEEHEIASLYNYIVGTGETIVTWNGDMFDIPYLITHATRLGVTNDAWGELPPSLDLMMLIRRATKLMEAKERWYKLEVITMANLGRGKISHGDEAALWLRSGDPELIQKAAEYCQDDVQLIMDLYALLERGLPLNCPKRPDRREYNDVWVFADGTFKR